MSRETKGEPGNRKLFIGILAAVVVASIAYIAYTLLNKPAATVPTSSASADWKARSDAAIAEKLAADPDWQPSAATTGNGSTTGFHAEKA